MIFLHLLVHQDDNVMTAVAKTVIHPLVNLFPLDFLAVSSYRRVVVIATTVIIHLIGLVHLVLDTMNLPILVQRKASKNNQN